MGDLWFNWQIFTIGLILALAVCYVVTRSFCAVFWRQLLLRIAETETAVADLADRFTRFQNRENMRSARSTKESAADVLSEAQAVLAERGAEKAPGSRAAIKAALRSRAQQRN